MTYNVRNFDLYNWSQHKASRSKMIDLIDQKQPDIICFQEFYSDEGKYLDNVSLIKDSLNLTHYYFTRELVVKGTRQWGIATFSKYPIISKQNILRQKYPTGYGKYPNKGIITNIKVGNDTLSIVNVHLQSIFLGSDDYEAIKDATKTGELDVNAGKSIIKKLIRAFERRGEQVASLKTVLEELKHPTILCGDFNDPPISYTYRQLSKGFQDAFLKAGFGAGITYNGPIPGLRIDHLLIDQSIKIHKTRVIKNKISDHSPLITYISLPK